MINHKLKIEYNEEISREIQNEIMIEIWNNIPTQVHITAVR